MDGLPGSGALLASNIVQDTGPPVSADKGAAHGRPENPGDISPVNDGTGRVSYFTSDPVVQA